MNPARLIWSRLPIVLIFMTFLTLPVLAARDKDWQDEKVDLRLNGKSRIKGISYPRDKRPILTSRERRMKQRLAADASTEAQTTSPATKSSISVNVIDSPPTAGFVPWIAVATSNAKSLADDLDFNAHDVVGLTGVPTASPTTNYSIGIYDTGASAHIMGYQAASDLGLINSTHVTDNVIEITGVTGSVETSISYPLGIFAQGLAILEPNGLDTSEYLLSDPSDMVGTTNTSIIVGQEPGPGDPDLPTALGSPLNVFFTAVIKNDQPITVRHKGEEYTGPDIGIHPHYSLSIPDDYPITLPLELRPLGGTFVQYLPDFNIYEGLGGDIFDLLDVTFDTPGSPSVVIGNLSQSVTFVASVDMTENGNSAMDRARFLLDTGAQVSVVGSRIGARLGLDPANPEFTVEIQGVTGDITHEPGFFIDSVNLPALGQWLRFTNVPVILLDVASPEGGTLDGIIGMNLFTEYNMVLRGGGLFLSDDPAIMLQPINPDQLVGDIAPAGGDGRVDLKDFAVLAEAWMTTPGDEKWNEKCDLAPLAQPDGIVDIPDIALFADHWLGGTRI
jgi:hypothetical protein